MNIDPFRILCDLLGEGAGGDKHDRIAAAFALPEFGPALMKAARRERVLPALHQPVETCFRDIVPKLWRGVLAAEYVANRERNKAIRAQTLEVAAAAHGRGLELIALKGLVWILEDETELAGWRSLLDIDLLAASDDLGTMQDVLAELGYSPVRKPRWIFGTRQHAHHFHLVPYARAGAPACIEIHRHLGWRPELLTNESLFRGRRPIARGLALPSPGSAALHAIIHWQVQHEGYDRGAFSLKDVVEISRHITRNDIDWTALAVNARRARIWGESEAAVAFATELLGTRAPHGFRPSEQARARVRRCLDMRRSPALQTRARKWSRARSLWRCDRSSYRAALHGTGPIAAAIILWADRLIRIPVLLFYLAGAIGPRRAEHSRQNGD